MLASVTVLVLFCALWREQEMDEARIACLVGRLFTTTPVLTFRWHMQRERNLLHDAQHLLSRLTAASDLLRSVRVRGCLDRLQPCPALCP